MKRSMDYADFEAEYAEEIFETLYGTDAYIEAVEAVRLAHIDDVLVTD